MSILRLAAVAAVTFVVFLPVAPTSVAADERSETYRQLQLFGDVFERVRAEFVEEVSDEELVEAAIRGMLTSLDPHSSYLTRDSFEDMQVQTKGEFGGLGIEVTLEDGYVRVVSPIDDTPAAKAGIQAGDLIIALDGEPVMGLTLAEAVEEMRGEVGSDITITVRRGDEEPFDITITREVITIQSVRSETFGNVGYLRITAFNEQTQPNLEESIARIKEELGDDLEGYVLDMRNNPGGLLEQAISVTDTFLDRGEIVSTRSRNPEDGKRYNAQAGDLTDGAPVVVLINGGSASASEIVAGALQDHGRAIVLGTHSFGKGSVQTIVPLPGHGAIRLTTARYYTPSGRSIQARGIAPDMEIVQATVEPVEQPGRREADLRGALINDNGAIPDLQSDVEVEEEDVEEEDSQAAKLREDHQLARAVDLLRGYKLFQKRMLN